MTHSRSTPPGPGDRRDRSWSRELAIVAAGYLIYSALRVVVEGSFDRAEANARAVIDVERAIGLDIERRAQDWVLDRPHWVTFWNFVYQWLYWPSVAVALILLWRLHRRSYNALRDTLIISAGLGLVVFLFWPVSPPRFLDGYVDTIQLNRVGYDRPTSLTNQYAAIPSFHVAWPAVAGIFVAVRAKHPLVQFLAMTPALLLAPAVVFTGNHFVLDVVAGLAVVGIASLLAVQLRISRVRVRWNRSRPPPN